MKKRINIIYILSFVLPVLVLFTGLYSSRIFPFGTRSFLHWDSNLEYLNFYEYYKTIITSNNNLFYSFSKNGGSPMISFVAYYNFFSPFNVLFFFSPDKYLNIALQILMFIKIGLCGLTFSYFINKEVKESYFSVFFALSYALSTHTICTILSNFVLIDGIIFLPLIISGISKIVKKNDYKLYLTILFLSILANAYMGYVSILFSCMFFFYKILLSDNIKQYLVNLKTFIFSTAIAVGLTSWLLIPVSYSLLQAGKYEYFNCQKGLFYIRNNIADILSQFFTANIPSDKFYEVLYPFIFVGILTEILFFLYFFNSSYSKKERQISLIFFLILFTIFMLNCLYIIFSMGVENVSGLLYRFGFIQVFFIIYIAYKSFIKIRDVKPKYILVFGLILSCFIAIKNNCYNDMANIENLCFIIDIVIIISLLLRFYCINKIKNMLIYKILLPGIFLLHIFNMGYNTRYIYDSQFGCIVSENINSFKKYVNSAQKTVKFIKLLDDDFYRIETQTNYIDNYQNQIINNAPMLLNFNGVSHYSSIANMPLMNFYEHIGYITMPVDFITRFNNRLQLFPTFFMGIKYIFSDEAMSKPFSEIELSTELFPNKQFQIYKNPYSLPIAFVINNNEYLFKDIKEKTITDYQNKIIKILADDDLGNIYNYNDISENIFNCLKEYFETHPNTTSTNEEKTENEEYINIEIPVEYQNELNGNIYLYLNHIKYTQKDFEGNFISQIKYGNEVIDSIFDDSVNQFIYLDQNIKGKTINFSLTAKINPLDLNNKLAQVYYRDYNFYIVNEDLNILEKYYNKLSENPCQLEKISSSHLKGSLNVNEENKLLFMSIPYDENWHIKINGETRKAMKVFNVMTAIPLSAGDTEIEMKYVPKGFYLGIIISMLSLLILLFNIIKTKKRN